MALFGMWFATMAICAAPACAEAAESPAMRWAQCLVTNAPDRASEIILLAGGGNDFGIPRKPCGELLPGNVDASIASDLEAAAHPPVYACIRASAEGVAAIKAFRAEYNGPAFSALIRQFELDKAQPYGFTPGIKNYRVSDDDKMMAATQLASAKRVQAIAARCNPALRAQLFEQTRFLQPLLRGTR
ncbi:hypothetical protein [Sphingomonas antarctica]|uniref:hypothetical protein n=1 Tax=Sphingomonas antarctica TaxID=2040274 RepID=UPI0039EA0771